MLKIDIILPYKEKFSPDVASAVSISVKNSINYSKFKKTINVYGQSVEKSFTGINFNECFGKCGTISYYFRPRKYCGSFSFTGFKYCCALRIQRQIQSFTQLI